MRLDGDTNGEFDLFGFLPIMREAEELADKHAQELFGDAEELPEDEMEIVWDRKLSHEQQVEQLTALRAKKFEAAMPGFSSEKAATQEPLTLFLRDLIAEYGLSIVAPWIDSQYLKLVDIAIADLDNRQKHLQSERFYKAALIFLKPREMPKLSNHKRTTKSPEKRSTRSSNVVEFPDQ